MVPPLLILALEFHRAPLRFRHLTDLRRPLPDAFGDWLTESSVALAPAHVEVTAEALGTSPEALREAYLFLLRQILLLPQADYYRVLGLARNCSSETVKQHHGLLVRLFHPDRLKEDAERSAALAARINNAHHVLRDPEARRLYDARLLPFPGGDRPNGDPTGFSRPQGTLVSVGGRAGVPSTLPSRTGPVLLWTLGFVVMMALGYAVVREPRQPLLRVNPDLAGGTAPGPSYMQGGVSSGHGTEAPGQASSVSGTQPDTEPGTASSYGSSAPPDPVAGADTQVRADAAKLVSAADGSAPAKSNLGRQAREAAAARDTSRLEASRKPGNTRMPDPVAPQAAAAVQDRRPQVASRIEARQDAKADQVGGERSRTGPPESRGREPGPGDAGIRGASELVGRLEGAFRNGDLDGLVSLFTANAVVNGGIGAKGIRNTYWEYIWQGGQRSMTLSSLRWRPGHQGRLLARGTIRIGTKRGRQADWSYATGAVDIEVVPAVGDYKIAKFVHQLSRK